MNLLNESNERVVDYVVVAGLPTKLTAIDENDKKLIELNDEQHQELLYPNCELESFKVCEKKEPIVDLAIINKTLNEKVPIGFECIWTTRAGHSANLSTGALFKSNELFLCIRRGTDKPPITDVGVFYEGTRERVMNGCTVIRTTVGNNSANLNNGSFNVDRVFITYRRGVELACNSLAVIDICVVLKSKGEQAPHSYNEIGKDLNRNLLGASVFLCYKKTWIPAAQIKYRPSVLYRYPHVDHTDLPFPSEVALFGLPMGAIIESWPTHKQIGRPLFGTFILNVNSEDGTVAEKVYGASLTFYEKFDSTKLSKTQMSMLSMSDKQQSSLYANKCLIILSRHALFNSFEHFLLFLYDKYTKNDFKIPIERYFHHIIYQVPFPTVQKPHIQVNLTESLDDQFLSINLPNESILPQSGASFIELLRNLHVDNLITVFLHVMLQRNVMIHSLRTCVLANIVEAISGIIFPFIWRYSYIPLCPLSLCQIIEAPGSFIIGMDTRFFDMYDAPNNVLCVDLDTNTISAMDDRHRISMKMVPDKALSALQTRLKRIQEELNELDELRNSSTLATNVNSARPRSDSDAKYKRKETQLSLSLREAFLRFMSLILFNYKNFLRTMTRKPDTKALDRNLATFFDCDGFIRSKEKQCHLFYAQLVRTQLFYDCIMNLSFTSELHSALADSFAFFDDICLKVNPLNQHRDNESSNSSSTHNRLLELNEHLNGQTVVILPPSFDLHNNGIDIMFNESAFVYDKAENTFPPLRNELFVSSVKNSATDLTLDSQSTLFLVPNPVHALQSNNTEKDSIQTNANTDSSKTDTQSLSSTNTLFIANNKTSNKLSKIANTPIGVRTKAEKLQAQRKIENKLSIKWTNNAQQNEKNKHLLEKLHAFCFLSNAYALWFIYLPEYLKACGENKKAAMNYAYQVLIQMQKHNLTHPDEICFRIMMQLCLLYKFPTLAVKIYLFMRKFKIEMTPITYSYYNKTLTEHWSPLEQDRWHQLKMILLVTAKFKQNLKLKQQRELLKKKAKKSNAKRNKKRRSTKSTQQHNKHNEHRIVEKQIDFPLSFAISHQIEKSNGVSIKNHHVRLKSDSFENLTFNSSIKHDKEFCVDLVGILIVTNTQSEYILKNNIFKLNKKKIIFRSFDGELLLRTGNKKVAIRKENNSNKEEKKNEEKEIEDINKSLSNQLSIDPLTAPLTINSTPTSIQNEISSKRAPNQEFNEVRKRLFDYKPFADNQPQGQQQQQKQQQPDQVQSKQDKELNAMNEKTPLKGSRSNGNNQQRKSIYDSDFEYENEDWDEYDEDEDAYSDDDDDADEDYEDENSGEEEEEEDDFDVDNEYMTNNDEDIESGDELNHESDLESSIASNKFKSRDNMDEVRSTNKSYADSLIDEIASPQENSLNSSDMRRNDSFTSPIQGDAAKKTNKINFIPMTPLFNSSKLASLMRKVENSIENSSSTFKGVSRFITDKSNEIKDVILSNTNQQNLASKLKSISGYNLNSPISLSNFIRSQSSNQTFTPNTTNGKLNGSKHAKEAELINKYILSKSDLDEVPKDDSFRPLTLKWWGLDKRDDFINSDKSDLDILIDIQITSCNCCENCQSFLFDEEIMSGWTMNESDLNIKCPYCSVYLVPNLFIKVQDLDDIRKYIEEDNNQNEQTEDKDENPLENDSKKPQSTRRNRSKSSLKLNTTELVVQYLSPLVVRKELENIITHKYDEESDEILIDANFVEEHSVIFWNLTWYFRRIGADSGQLATIILNKHIESLKNQLKSSSSTIMLNGHEQFDFMNFIPSQSVVKPCGQHPHVKIKCMWNNLKLNEKMQIYEVPLYLSWLHLNVNYLENATKMRLITALSVNELKHMRKSQTNFRNLAKLFELIQRNILESDVVVPLRSLLRERTRSKTNYASIYREILFFILVILNREQIDMDAFDSEYREAYKSLSRNESQEQLKNFDKPPNNVAVWCRRLFSPLLL